MYNNNNNSNSKMGRSWEDDGIGPDVSAAGRLISDCISKDTFCSSSSDLDDLLEASRYSSHPYSTPPKQWPAPVEIVNSRELPSVLVERYNAAGGEGTALCGLFPEIRRAWASVDSSLFLWRFDKWDGQCPEYNSEEQAICAVGIAKVKPQVFAEAIQYLIVLATPVELVLLGVCCATSGDGTDPYADLTIQLLPEYTIPTDGVTMTCVASTDRGQIFLAGRDGHIYELQYFTGSCWHRRCRKLCVTGGLGNIISRWVIPSVLKFGAVDPVVELAVDNERHILYARTQDSKIQIFDLGKNGDGPIKKIAEERNLCDHRDSRFGNGRGGRAGSRASKTSIISISTLSTVESKWLHLVAVTSDGRRLFLSTYPNAGTGVAMGGMTGVSNIQHRPSVLKLVSTRPSPSIGLASGLTFGSVSIGNRPQPESLVMKVEAAYYSGGILLLSDVSANTASKLIIVNRDFSAPVMAPSNFPSLGVVGATNKGSCQLKEMISSIQVDGRTLSMADVLPSPLGDSAVQASFVDSYGSSCEELSEMTRAKKLWARGELATQHLLPRRRAVVFSTTGLMELVVNRPVDILHTLLDSSAPRSVLEDFFHRFGKGEAAAMCLLLAARLVSDEESVVSNIVAERAAEAFEDIRIVGLPKLQGSGSSSNAINPASVGFNMGQVVQDEQPVFSGSHEGLCLCASRLLWPVWELPVMTVKRDLNADMDTDIGLIECRLSIEAMQILENKIRSLEQFLRSRRNQRRGVYGRVFGLGDMNVPRLYDTNGGLVSLNQAGLRSAPNNPGRGGDQGSIPMSSNKRQRVPYDPNELAALEVRSIECVRRLLRRSGEALLLLQLLAQHHVIRIAQNLDISLRQKLAHLTFHQLVCSEEGDEIATRLVAALVQYYIGSDGRGTVDDISSRLREGCPSYYNDSDYKFFQAVEFLERAAVSVGMDEREHLLKESLNILLKVPESADLLAVCPHFEELRFYEAVVELPLHKARALDPAEDAFNEQIDPARRQAALALREQCYEVVINALRSLKGDQANGIEQEPSGFSRNTRHSVKHPMLDQASRERYIRQIIHLSVRWPDQAFHEYLYRTLVQLGLENELLELAGPDLVPFLQKSCQDQQKSGNMMARSDAGFSFTPARAKKLVNTNQAKYLELLARYYVQKRQHALAAHVLLRLAERRQIEGEEALTLDKRHQYLSNALLQARSAMGTGNIMQSVNDVPDSTILELLEGKLAVLRFQISIKEELEKIASGSDSISSGDASHLLEDSLTGSSMIEDSTAQSAGEKAIEISMELKSITDLYNNYAVPFQLWEICLEMLHFSSYNGDIDPNIMRETWARVLDQALTRGGVAEACSVLKRVGSKLYPGDGATLPLDTICIHLEKAALERTTAGKELVGDEDIARALLSVCKNAPEAVQRAYDRLLSSGAILPTPALRIRLIRSVLTVLREWTVSALAQRIGTSATGASIVFGGLLTPDQTPTISKGIKDKIISAATRYMTEVRRLPLPQSHTEAVYRGFKELEEMLLGSSTF